ncbi:hypothetical protein DPMN_088027 [Dreissena polymorpha]|uniref:F5/8 type C domain-containing protein n=1 Tax=Dreissena polymorpha TaxID=45954 RepID=A0A9D4KV57_DREPO|nr:hypothetical protein DPMN_088027 [Dreissena polymorpha]
MVGAEMQKVYPSRHQPCILYVQTRDVQSQNSKWTISNLQCGLATSGVSVLALILLIMMIALCKKYRKKYVTLVDLLATYDVTGVTILGRADEQEWTVAYTFLFSTDGVHFSPLLDTIDGGESKSFDGNTDRSIPVTRNFTAVTTRWIRIFQNASMGHIALGFDVLGCHGNTIISTTQVADLKLSSNGVNSGYDVVILFTFLARASNLVSEE